MTHFPLDRLQTTATPLYYYDVELLRMTLRAALESAAIDPRFRIHYAVKANHRPDLLRIIASYGLGADCVSGNEVKAAVEAGFNNRHIVFAGVGKTDSEINAALAVGIGCFNVESEQELEVINELAACANVTARVAIRVNPEIDAHTHRYITTGLSENKFGIGLLQLDGIIDKALRLSNISLTGLHFHIGSQIREYDCFKLLCERVNEITARQSSRGVTFSTINVGGGLGVNYLCPDDEPIPDFSTYFGIFHKYLRLEPQQELHFELGRSIIAQCGSLITRVTYIKEGATRRFAIVDAGMTDLIRPALYQAHHKIEAISAPKGDPELRYDVVGPVCESSDTFGIDELLPELHRGDMLAIRSAGAYGEAMASRYNLRELPGAMLSQEI